MEGGTSFKERRERERDKVKDPCDVERDRKNYYQIK